MFTIYKQNIYKQKFMLYVCETEAKMKLLVDCREHKIISLLQATEQMFTTSQLDVGDFLISDENDQVLHIVERKSLSDIAASIKDHRYQEQKLRLLEFRKQNPQMRVSYIFEGCHTFDDDVVFFGLSGKALNTVIYNLQFKDNISVLMTPNLVATSNLILSLFARYENGKYMEWSSDVNNEKQVYEECAIKSRKKDNNNIRSCFLQQLCSIPGISYTKALAIIQTLQVENMYQLLQKLGNEIDGGKLIGSVDGIGKKLSVQITKHLFATDKN
jgi:ERCC4-type nuclease